MSKWVEDNGKWVGHVHTWFSHLGYVCVVMEPGGEGTGFCAYVGFAEGHMYHGMPIQLFMKDIRIDVHGGVTWSDYIPEITDCPGLWWIGFDMRHGFDIDTYMDVDKGKYYVRNRRVLQEAIDNTHSLCKQLERYRRAVDPLCRADPFDVSLRS